MGPITLFDKSFLQSLNLDESVWLDHFFLLNVCPLFYGETLADLEKTVREGRTPEQEVGIIADKFPEMHGMPCSYHRDLCMGELLGYSIPMTGQVPLAGGLRVESRGGRAAVFEPSPEADAFARWQRREFLEIERQYARVWRRELSTLDEDKVSAAVVNLGLSEKCKDLEQAKLSAAKAMRGGKKPYEWISLALAILGVSERYRREALKRWVRSGKPALVEYAPYTAFVVEVEVFFQVALASDLISKERASNRLDIAYLFYLPFCMMLVSNDLLHQRSAPLFLRPDQEFVWGPELKINLGELNKHYLGLPESQRQEGLYSFADEPPRIGNQVVYNLWDRLLPRWREPDAQSQIESDRSVPTAAEVIAIGDAPSLQMIQDGSGWNSGDLDQAVIKRLVKKTKGNWHQLPVGLGSNEPS